MLVACLDRIDFCPSSLHLVDKLTNNIETSSDTTFVSYIDPLDWKFTEFIKQVFHARAFQVQTGIAVINENKICSVENPF